MLLLLPLAFAGEITVGLDVGAPRTTLLHANSWGEDKVPTGTAGAGLGVGWRWKDTPVSGALGSWTRASTTGWVGGGSDFFLELGADVLVSGRVGGAKVIVTLEAGGGPEAMYGFSVPSLGLHATAGGRVTFPGAIQPWLGLRGEGVAAPVLGVTLQSYPSSSYLIGGLGGGLVGSAGLAF